MTADSGNHRSALASAAARTEPDRATLDEGLRHDYLAGNGVAAAASHYRLGDYFARDRADYRRAFAHHLASALLLAVARGADRRGLIPVARDLSQLPGGAVVPDGVGELSAAVGEIPGVHLDRLLSQLNRDPAAVQGTLDALLGQARTWADPDTPLPWHLASWDPVIAGLAAARAGGADARAAVEQHLAERMPSAEWGRLAAAFRTLLDDGPNGPGLLDGLDKIDTAITDRALAALRGDLEVPSLLRLAIPFTGLIGQAVTAAWGDQAIADQLTQSCARMEADRELAPLGAALLRILAGERGPAVAHDLAPVQAAVVITILFHLPPAREP